MIVNSLTNYCSKMSEAGKPIVTPPAAAGFINVLHVLRNVAILPNGPLNRVLGPREAVAPSPMHTFKSARN